MSSIESSTLIQAPSNIVWSWLTAFEEYNQWHPYLTAIEGFPQVGALLHLVWKEKALIPSSAEARLIRYREQESLAWEEHLALGGIIAARRNFELTSISSDQTLLQYRTTFIGPLIHFFKDYLDPTSREAGEHICRGIKKTAESEWSELQACFVFDECAEIAA